MRRSLNRNARWLCAAALLAAVRINGPANGQSSLTDTSGAEDLRDVVERYAEEEHGLDLFEDLAWLIEHPLDLNAASRDELLRIPGVTAHDADFVIRLRRRLGGISSLDQLRRIGSDGIRLSFLLSPYVRFHTTHRASLRLRSRWLWNPGGVAAGASDQPLGPRSHEQHRIDASIWEPVSFGAYFDRDAGERYRDAFTSVYLRLTNLLMFDELILGDYRAKGALGLALGSPASAFGTGVRGGGISSDTRIEPFHGASESDVLRGLAGMKLLRFQAGTLRLSGLFSRTPLSASLDSSGNITGIGSISAFTTEEDLVRRNNAHETTVAMRAVFSARAAFSLGISVLHARLSRPRIGSEFFAPTRSVRVIALDGSLARGPVSLWGECSWSGAGMAIAGRIQLALDDRTSFACAAWYYGPDYWNPRAGGSEAGTDVRNHGGVCLSWIHGLSNSATLTGYIEHYRRPWRTTFDPMPPSGSEISVGISLRVAPKTTLEGRIISSQKERVGSGEGRPELPDKDMVLETRNRARCGLEVSLGPLGAVRSRVDWVQVRIPGEGKSETGWMLLQEMRIGWPGLPRVYARLSLHQTDSYLSRLYAQERDVEGAYANPPCYGTGMRWYVVIRRSVGAGITFSAKYAASSGMSGPFSSQMSSTVSMQVDYQTGPE